MAAIFYCLMDKQYLCELCFNDHRAHLHLTDSIKNLLANLFSEWRNLLDHAQTKTCKQMDRNMIRQKELLLYLKKNSTN